ncbi:MAG: queuosine precursor transporter [Phycisphaerales bacterium]
MQDEDGRSYKLYWFLVCLYIALQLVSDVTAGKITTLGGFPVSVTVLYFPITYIFADVLTEVYGYSRARRALWTVLCCSILAGLLYQLAVYMPPADGFDANDAYRRVLGTVPRILLGGWIAVFAGEISNNFVMAKMKVWTNGRHLWTRTIGSTIVGQFVNTVLFYTIALLGVLPTSLIVESIITGWVIKTLVEAAMTPVTYLVVGFLKRVEQEDYFDTETDFNPFVIK